MINSKLFVNGTIITLDSDNKHYEAIGVRDNIITFLGSNTEAIAISNSYDDIISLNGMTVIPGFNDSHMHLLNYGYTLKKMDLTKIVSIQELIDQSKKHILNHSISNDQWLLGRGWNQDRLFENRFPTRDDLDQISTDIPIVFTRVCGHISVCNSVVIDMLKDFELSNQSSINIQDGHFMEEGLNLLYALIPTPSKRDIKEMIVHTGNRLIEYGITSVQTDDLCTLPDQNYESVLSAYNELHADNQLPLRIYQQCLFFEQSKFESFVEKGYHTGLGDQFFKIGPLKLLLDGSLGGRTALLRSDYSDAPGTSGIACFTQSELNNFVEYAVNNHFQIAAHAIGDQAMIMILDAYDLTHLTKDSRHGIVHAQITADDIIGRMADSKVIAYVQPIFLDYDLHIVYDRVGERANKSYAFKSMKSQGVPVAFGTDSPVVDFNPFENLYAAITRKDLQGNPQNGYLPEERFSILEALKAYTKVGAYCSFEEQIKGTLEIGKLADFIVLKKNPLECAPEEIKEMIVEMTVLNGQVVYSR